MKSLWLASLINIILCPLFIHWFGLKGAAIATVCGRSCGVLYQCYFLFFSDRGFRLRLAHFKNDWPVIGGLIKVAWPAALQFIIASGSWILLSRRVSEIGGTTALAGYQIAIRNIIFFILPAWGLSNAVATLVGQNLGAGQIDRAEKSVWITTKYNAIFMAFVMLLFLFFNEAIISFFTNDPAVVAYGAKAIQIVGSAFIFYGISMVMTQALNGAGDTRTPTLIYLFCFWLIQIPLAYFLSSDNAWKTTGVFIAIPVAETLIALVALYFFKKGKWKTVKV